MTNNAKTDMLTAREIQERLQIDRSTVHRMAEAGQLPAIKVGKQWRFPADQFQQWYESQVGTTAVPTNTSTVSLPNPPTRELGDLLSWEWLRLVQEMFAELLGVMIVVTDIEGHPINQPTNPCGLYTAVSQQPGAMAQFIQSWRGLAAAVDLTPTFRPGHLGLHCARSLIAVGTELKGMVIAGCVAPDNWPPPPEVVSNIAHQFGMTAEELSNCLHEVYKLDATQKRRVLDTLPKISALIAHIVEDRKQLVDRLETIAALSQL
ncbi:MAG: helix-turn-helix domain-containing protein [Bacteroidetes bacterium]|nr:MAG: helix-turn-helix domain-containing protein [Bacteroidota bacterium]